MESEELIRTIMAEVMANLDKDAAKIATRAPASSTGSSTGATTGPTRTGTVGRSDYPLGEKIPDRITSPTNRPLTELTFEQVMAGKVGPEDVRISKDTLELQAQVADSVGRDTLAKNFRRAAELTAVPDDKLLATYDALRPYRSTKKELYDLAAELEGDYQCSINAAFIREAADVYESRGRLRAD